MSISIINEIVIRRLNNLPWKLVVNNMNIFTKQRNSYTKDEIWLVQHPATFTIGRKYKKKNDLCEINSIPLLHSDRGGGITYHGPGQQIFYILIDIKRRKIGIRKLINLIHKTLINVLFDNFKIFAYSINGLPGIYINQKKVCSLGLKIINGCTIHGFAVNIKMDLSPFKLINPCDDKNLEMTQISDFYTGIKIDYINKKILYEFIKLLHLKN